MNWNLNDTMILKLEALIITALPALLLNIDDFRTAHGFFLLPFLYGRVTGTL